jgi:hypothetical protein
MTLAMGPLIILFELSILLARWLERVSPRGRSSRWGDDDDEDGRPQDVDDPHDDGDYDPFADDEFDAFDEASDVEDLSKLKQPDRKD